MFALGIAIQQAQAQADQSAVDCPEPLAASPRPQPDETAIAAVTDSEADEA